MPFEIQVKSCQKQRDFLIRTIYEKYYSQSSLPPRSLSFYLTYSIDGMQLLPLEGLSIHSKQAKYGCFILFDYFCFGWIYWNRHLAVTLPRLDRTVRYLTLSKFVLSLVYWLSSTTIFVLLGSTKFIFNNPLVLFVFVFLFFSSLYFSVIRVADMRKKDWLIIGGVLGGLVLLFFLPKL